MYKTVFRAVAAIIATSFISSCILLYDDPEYSHNHYFYDFDPELLEVGWECYDSGFFDKWHVWARAYDEDGYEDLFYLHVRIYSLLSDDSDIIEMQVEEHVNGYFQIEREYHIIQCDEPIDVEYTIIDNNNNSDQYVLYW